MRQHATASLLFTRIITISESIRTLITNIEGIVWDAGSWVMFAWVAIAILHQRSKPCAQRRCKLTRLPINWRVANELRINQPSEWGRGLRHRKRDGGICFIQITVQVDPCALPNDQ